MTGPVSTAMREKDIRVQSADAALAATYCRPSREGPFPVVLMIHGSGPLDRNENMRGQRLDIFNTIAHGLAERGIGSLRYDKRGCGVSAGDYLRAGHKEFVADAVSCLDALVRQEGAMADRVFVLGHSEGCIIAPQVCLRRPRVSGMILLCPFIGKLETMLMNQASQLEKEAGQMRGMAGYFNRLLIKLRGNPVDVQRRLIQKLKTSSSAVIRVGFSRVPAKWYREFMAVDPVGVFSSTKTPMLLIGGEKDLQCDPDDVFRIAEVSSALTETWIVKDMTHVLRTDAGEPSIAGSFRLLDRPMEHSVIERIAEWLERNMGRRNNLTT